MPRREEKKRKEETGKMSVEEAGKKGGETTRETHGREFYQEIGKKGGEERAREIREEGISPETREKLSEAGHRGGETTKETHGREFYQEIGRKGGTAPKGAGASERSSSSYPKGQAGAASRGAARGEAAREEVSERGEVTVRRSGKDLDIMFSSQEEAEDWRNRFASMMEQEGYHLTREKPEAAQAEAEASTSE